MHEVGLMQRKILHHLYPHFPAPEMGTFMFSEHGGCRSLNDWLCSSQKWRMSREIQARQQQLFHLCIL